MGDELDGTRLGMLRMGPYGPSFLAHRCCSLVLSTTSLWAEKPSGKRPSWLRDEQCLVEGRMAH